MKENNKYIDLSILLTKNTPVFPGEPNIVFKQHANIKENTYNEHKLLLIHILELIWISPII